MAQEIQVGRGSEPKNSSSGVTFNFNFDRYILTTYSCVKKNFAMGKLVLLSL